MEEEQEIKKEKPKGKVRKVLDLIRELKKTPRGRSFLFFGGYLIFFVVVFAALSVGSNVNRPNELDRIREERHEPETEFNFNFEGIQRQNYEFLFVYQIDEDKVIFEGRKDRNRSEFTKTTDTILNYIERNNRFFLVLEDEQTEVINPFYYNEFLNIDLLISIIDQSTYVSRTEYADGTANYQFDITTENLIYLVDGIEVGNESVNRIEIVVNNEREVQGIILDLSNYAYYRDGTISVDIHFMFSNFEEVDFNRIEEEALEDEEYSR